MNNIDIVNHNKFKKIFEEHLKIETYSQSIDSLFSPRMKSKINYKPYYQRNYVWKNDKATYFIESILVGTEIPPLIFFRSGNSIEVIDGRQRFETIERFLANSFSLSSNGLLVLKSLNKKTFSVLEDNIRDSFLDSKLRIIEFQVVNQKMTNPMLEDEIKKEIFRRYNSGITPLKKSEIENAEYNDDIISDYFKNKLKGDIDLAKHINKMFMKNSFDIDKSINDILLFVRRYLVLNKFPISSYAGGAHRTALLKNLYDILIQNTVEPSEIYIKFVKKIKILIKFQDELRNRDIDNNRLINECLIWALYVLENEEISYSFLNNKAMLNKLVDYLEMHMESYDSVDSNFYAKIVKRYQTMLTFFEEHLKKDLHIYVSNHSYYKNEVEKIKEINTKSNIEIDTEDALRTSKPEPSKQSVDDIVRKMTRRKFLLRPTYQRTEVINTQKSSSIIESILLKIPIPPIFLYKRLDGITEVIDGQQRLLSILGFINEPYIDENGDIKYSKKNLYKLSNLEILSGLKGCTYNDLTDEFKEKILDFQMFIVEIDEKHNPNFKPIDLFIRLNDKPYPIRQNSFEMWNSWVDKDIIQQIKANISKYDKWFYLKSKESSTYRNRMENEELYTTLCYLCYDNIRSGEVKELDIYAKGNRIQARVKSMKNITQLLNKLSQDVAIKNEFNQSIKQVESFIKKLKLILINQDIYCDDKDKFLSNSLNDLFNPLKLKGFRRTKKDFYILWYILYQINYEMVKKNRVEINQELKNIYSNTKNIDSQDKFNELIREFMFKYKVDERKLRLNDKEKKELIKKQQNKCGISQTSLFWGDDIEVDHTVPISIGGKDEYNNLQIVHKDENRKKGSKLKE